MVMSATKRALKSARDMLSLSFLLAPWALPASNSFPSNARAQRMIGPAAASSALPASLQPELSCTTTRLAAAVRHVDDEEMIRCFDRVAGMEDLETQYNCGDASAVWPADLVTCTSITQATWLIGPFTSTGGFDWWAFNATLDTSALPAEAAVGSWAFTFHAGAPSETGEASAQLLLPPLHNHHTKFGVGSGGLAEHTEIAGDVARACPPSDLACQAYDLAASNHYKILPLDGASILSLYNDVRPAGSSPLVWHLRLTLTFESLQTAAARSMRPVELMSVAAPARLDSWFGTLNVPKSQDALVAFEGRWPVSGTFVGWKRSGRHHAHAAIFHYAFLIDAPASELGLRETRFASSNGCDPPTARAAGFTSNAAMLGYLRRQCPSCFAERLLCWANETLEVIDGVAYDRLPTMRCREDRMPFVQNVSYTSLTFTGPRTETFSPEPASTRFAAGVANEDAFPMHSTWNLYYELASGVPATQFKEFHDGEFLLTGPGQDIDTVVCIG